MSKSFFFIIWLLVSASSLEAQFSHAYDPNYVDFSAKMDTLRRVATGNFNAGLLNDDAYDDLALTDYLASSISYQYGGPLLFDSTPLPAPFAMPYLRGDFDGHGIQDLFAVGGNISGGPSFFSGKKTYPYFGSATETLMTHLYQPGTEAPHIIGTADCNGDGISDIVAFDGYKGDDWLFVYYGGTHFDDSGKRYADDSVQLVSAPGLGAAVGVFAKGGKPMVFFATAMTSPDTPHTITYKIGIVRNLNDLAHDSIVYLSHTTDAPHWYNPGSDSMIAATGLYTMDITGDGIPDLLVTDGVYIYIFKGTDSLGYYPLTKDRAYYRIPHPVLLEGPGSDWSYIDQWAVQMFNCGDLTGSGVPVLGVEGQSSTSGDYDAVFFYSGGKALDSLFDGLLYHNVQFDGGYENLDTLHSIDGTGRSAVLVPLFGGPDLVLNRDGDKMPHQTNPRLSVQRESAPSEFNLSAVPSIANRYVKIHAASPEYVSTKLTIFNLLGASVASQTLAIDPGDNIEYFDTSHWPSGTYIVELSASGSVDDRSSAKVSTTRFIVQH